MVGTIDKLANKGRLFRRLILIWSICLVTYFVHGIMDHDFLIAVGTAGASVVIAVIGILATVISFYQWHRNQDDKEGL